MGGSCKIVKLLQAIYSSVKSCVRTNTSNNVNSAYFDSFMGVKQGEPLSPFLFICFINDMYTFIKDGSFDVVNIDDLQLLLLLFADDTVLFCYSKEGLQFQLNQLYTYCYNWGIPVNTAKTVVMVFKKHNRRTENVELMYDNQVLKVVKCFTCLGVIFSSNSNFHQTQKSRSKKSLKERFSLNSVFDMISLDIYDKVRFFDSMVLPIL